MKHILLIIFLVFATTASAQKLKGKWSGIGHQIDGEKWDIALHFKGKKKILINYPSLGCSGIWTLKEVTNNTTLSIFKEEIIVGTDKCDQGGEVYLEKIDEKQMKVIFYLRSYDTTNPIAEGILYRKKWKKNKTKKI
jgi:hypothetical protein